LHSVFAASPSFPIQQISDALQDWNVQFNSTENTIYSSIAKEPFGCLSSNFIPSDIDTVNYFSNGRYLNATMWLASPLEDPTNDIIKREYFMLLDIKSIYDPGSADYGIGFTWTNETNSWRKELSEFEMKGTQWKYLKIIPGDTGFFEKGHNYISLSLDLESINSPNEYRVLFGTSDSFMRADMYCHLEDVTQFFSVPPPQYNITTSENSLFLRPGQQETVELKIKSDATFPSYSYLSVNAIDGLDIEINPNILSLPPKGAVTSLINVKVLENATVHPYTLSIIPSIFPNETLAGISRDDPLEGILAHKIPSKTTDLTVVVLEPLTVLDYINNALNTYGTAVREFFTLMTVIGGAGISGWILNKIRHKRKKQFKKIDDWK
jgi:hypothetical protein